MTKRLKLVLTLVVLVAVSISVLGCSKVSKNITNNNEKKIMVFAAASLTESFNEIGKKFEEDKKIDVVFNFAGSQALVQSINQGSPADIFASANTNYMDELKKIDKIEGSKAFAENKLVICISRTSKISVNNFKDLSKDGLKLVIGDKTVPVGSYFYKVLEEQKQKNSIDDYTYNAIKSNIKSNELNVKDVLAKVILGEADAGVVYKTDINEANKDKVDIVETSEFNNLKVQYPIAKLKASKNKEEAEEFITYITEGKGKDILKKHGFNIQ
ncbi:molybdate ABC transporter substrate-binding protein [Clostridium folliculivorans]|uniref:Molybdate ABC transporter substrate-binding protein n=1 Tax=Clostridium folliculivorans TaxID=2886038 RepID=A0A9W5Y192_9CLOT|nr:molybdate ABC transporter substrate-binding protein [Clostridium folliculivorans]GKU24846.1 molybdate ABC transporter substrate-binding protein [Clostridium folliculivorans]GKU30944.1 molybdate ABC transporter substrate-binding protein [Clostridium folliculivorans]